MHGPRILAVERCVLVRASPATGYQVTIRIHGDAGATMWLGALPAVAFPTNGVGHGVGHGIGRFSLPLSGVDQSLHGLTLYLVRELSTGEAVACHTPVSKVVLD